MIDINEMDDPFNCFERVENDVTGVLVNEKGAVEPGLVVFHTVVDNKILVIDDEGTVVTEFSVSPDGYDIYRPAKPGYRASIFTILVNKRNRKRRKIVEMNGRGEIIWETRHKWFTHDFHILKDRHVLSVVREPREQDGRLLSDTVILEMSAEGKVLWRWSTWDHIDELTDGDKIRDAVTEKGFDNPFHINSIQFIDSNVSEEMFGEPVIVVSARNVDKIFIVGRRSNRILVDISGLTYGQHHARLLPDKFPGKRNIIVFDNGLSFWPDREGPRQSRVIEYNLKSEQIVWEYKGSKERPFFSPIVGAQQRFESGNTMITEGYYGRVFEVNYEGEIVWDYVYPGKVDQITPGKELWETGLRQIYRAYKVDYDWYE